MPKLRSYSKYKKEYVKLVDTYLKEKAKKNKEYEEKRIKKVDLPTLNNFALYVGVTSRTITNWEKEKPAFKRAMEKLKLEQETMLINNSLAGNYSPVIAKLILGNNFGMFDNSNIRVDAKIENTFTDEQANRIADRIAGRKREVDSAPSTK